MFEGTLIKKFEGRRARGSAPRGAHSSATTATSARGLIARQGGNTLGDLQRADLVICQLDLLTSRSSSEKADDHDV